MNKWNMNDVAAQENQPLTSDDEMNLDNSLPRRERGQTFSDNNKSEHQLLMEDLVRLAHAFDPIKKGPTKPMTEGKENGSAAGPSDNTKSNQEKTSEAELPARAANRKNHARKHTMVDCRSLQTPFNVEGRPQEAKRDPSHAQSGSQHK